MRATGIVRRIDELGRVVIPKEIRRTLRIREGDPLEIYTENDGEVIFKKYSPMGELAEFAGRICEAVQKNVGYTTAVCDRDGIIAAAGREKKELVDQRLSRDLARRLEEREHYSFGGRGVPLRVTDVCSTPLGTAVPILSEGDLLGGVLLLADQDRGRYPGQLELKLLETVAAFLGRQMES